MDRDLQSDFDRSLEVALERLRGAASIPFGQLRSDVDHHNKAAARNAIRDLIPDGVRHATRTLPLRVDRRPREPTKATGMDLDEVVACEFEHSSVGGLLRCVLFVPVVKPETDDPAHWMIEAPFVWRPSPTEWDVLGRDYADIRAIVRRGEADALSSSMKTGYGRWLMPKTSGRDSGDLVTYTDQEGRQRSARRRAFFLRAELTSDLLARQIELEPQLSPNLKLLQQVLQS